MKWFVIMVGCLLMISCKELKKKLLPTFNVQIPEIHLTVPPIPFVAGQEVPVGALKMHINLDSTIKAHTGNTLGASAVSSVQVKKVTIKLENGDSKNNLSNFESARMKIYSNTDTTSTDIVGLHFPHKPVRSFTMTQQNGPDILPYLRGPELGYNLFWKNRKTTSKFLRLVLSVTLSVQ